MVNSAMQRKKERELSVSEKERNLFEAFVLLINNGYRGREVNTDFFFSFLILLSVVLSASQPCRCHVPLKKKKKFERTLYRHTAIFAMTVLPSLKDHRDFKNKKPMNEPCFK